MSIEFIGPIWFWRGPAPWYFVTVPAEESADIKATSGFVTYGWGIIPVRVRIGNTEWATSLFPKDDCYLVPIKASVRQAENLAEGDEVVVQLEVGWRAGKKNKKRPHPVGCGLSVTQGRASLSA